MENIAQQTAHAACPAIVLWKQQSSRYKHEGKANVEETKSQELTKCNPAETENTLLLRLYCTWSLPLHRRLGDAAQSKWKVATMGKWIKQSCMHASANVWVCKCICVCARRFESQMFDPKFHWPFGKKADKGDGCRKKRGTAGYFRPKGDVTACCH